MDGTVAEAQEEMDKEEVAVKMSGYLEKRGKFRLVATWKRYWFVLEGRLLLYYGSEQDYINLSACRGSINMGLVSCVRPGSTRGSKQHDGFTIEVVTRTQLIVLRMKERSVQEQWLQALLDSIGGSLQGLTSGGSGTLHFRYSMDTLPTATKKEASLEEKQSTLPRPKHDSSRSHQQSIIRHIKKIGGKSYIGSLDAVLKVRNNVYGSEHREDVLENNILNGHLQQKKAPGEVKASADSSSKDPSHKDSESCTPLLVLPQAFGETLLTQNHDSSLALYTNSGDRQADVSVYNSTGSADTMEVHNVSNHISQMPANEETHMVNDKISNGIQSEDGLLQNKTEGEVTENRLYHNRNGSSYEVLSTLNDQNSEPESPHPTDLEETELEYPYEDLATKSPQNSEGKHNSFTGSEDVYYSCYDKASLMEQLKNEQLDSAEPELPPRPHMSPELTENCKGLTLTHVEDDYAEYCTLDTAAPPLSPSTHSTTSSVESADKKEKKRHGAWKRKKRSESVSADENDTKVKRKISFIHKLVKKYHKKKSKHQNGTDVETVEENDGAEYAVVEYNTIQSGLHKERGSGLNKDKLLAEDDEEQTHDKSAANLCSAKSLLPNNTFQELQLRLRQRASPHCTENTDEEPDYEAEYAVYTEIPKEQASSETPGIARRKPVPVPRKNTGKSMEELTDGPGNGSTQQTANTPPQLPPRRLIRPRSPWHDVPSNNSPVYGNCEELFGTKQRDSLLGTPEGYAMVKNKWQVAEMTSNLQSKGTQWNRELRQVTFPSRLGQRVLQWQEEASGDSGCGCCIHGNQEQCTQHAINVVVEKHTCEIAGVDLHTDIITSSGNGTGDNELLPSHTSQPSSESDVKIEPVSNNSNKITLVATVHSEESIQCSKQHGKVLDGFHIVSNVNSHHKTNAEHIETSECKEGANTITTGETTTMNIHRAGSDTKLSTDSLGECLNTDILLNTARNCDTSTAVTDSSRKAINVEQTELEEDRKPKYVEKKSYKSVSDITLRIAEPCAQKNEKIHNTNVCTSKKGKISEDIDPDSLMSDNASQCSAGLSDKQEQEHSNRLFADEHNWNICKCISTDSCKNCAKKVNNKSLPDSLSSAEWNSSVHDDSLENFEEVELRKHPGMTYSSSVVRTQTSDEPMCLTCSLKAASAKDVIFDGTKAIQCIRYNDDGCITDKQVVPVTKRYSDELNLLLAQLAEITSAPLLSPGVTISLVDFPEKRKHPGQVQGSEFDEWAAIGPIRRRRHSDPDYDVPRPHRSLLQLLLSGSEKEKTDNTDTIEATRFFGKTDPCASVIPDPESSVGDEHEMQRHDYSESESCSKHMRNSKNLVQHQTDTPTVSITPDSLEVEQP